MSSQESSPVRPPVSPSKKNTPVVTREDSLELEAVPPPAVVDDTTNIPLDDDDGANLPPGRMHAVKGHHRLHGSSGNLNYSELQHQTSSSGSTTPLSRRSRSPAGSRSGDAKAGTMTTHDANSSISSFEDLDILTDRGAFDDLSESQRKLHSSGKEMHMPPVINERLTEDTELDVYAFSDATPVCRSSNASRVSGNTDREGILEPLDEVEEDVDSGSDEGEIEAITTTVILTNMENLNIEQENDEAIEPATTASSIQEEAPSAPTA